MVTEHNLPIEEPEGLRPQESGDSEEPELPDGSQGGEQSGAEAEVPPVPGSDQAATFYDATKVPPELKPTFQEMQASLTRKYQELANQRRSLEPVQQKAQLFDALMADPEVVDVLNTLRTQRGSGGRGSDNGDEGTDAGSGDDPRVRNLENQFQQMQRQMEQQLIQSSVFSEREELTKCYPDWPKYRDWMGVAIQENPNRDLEAAYLVARARVEEHRRQTQGAKKPPLVEAPSSAASRGRPSHSKTPDSWEDAVRMTLDERGLDRRDLR